MTSDATQDDLVRLEFAAAVEMDAARVMRFVQELRDVPEDAWCEVQNVWSKAEKEKRSASVLTTVQMRCERCVADFLCRRFSTQTRHVSCGEMLLVRCRRVYLRTMASSSSTSHSQRSAKLAIAPADASTGSLVKNDEKRPTTLPRSTMIDLLDLLGDDIVEVLETFQRHAANVDDDASKLTIIGLIQALQQLASREQAVTSSTSTRLPMPSQRDNAKRTSREAQNRSQVHHIRHLLTRMAAHGAVSLTSLPDKNDSPFLSYTDFIAVYVGYMSTTSGSCDADKSANSASSVPVNTRAK